LTARFYSLIGLMISGISGLKTLTTL